MRKLTRMRKNKKRKRKIVSRLILLSFIGIICFLVFKNLSFVKGKTFSSNFKNESTKKSETNKKEDSAKKDIAVKLKKDPVEVTLSSLGDCTIGTDPNFDKSNSLVTTVMSHNEEYSYLFKNVLHILNKDDVTIANLETTFTDSTKKSEKQYTFKSSPKFAKSLHEGSIEGVNISNNHIYDFQEQGFNDTIKALKENNINYFGEGNRWIKDVKGVKLGFLGYNAWEFSDELANSIKKDIQELKSQNCNAVIINFHWGNEGKYYPNSVQKDIAHYAIDQGADLIIGHHPHVIEGMEKYKDKVICYSMANFCFGGNSNPQDKDTFILQAKFEFKENNLSGYNVRVIPCSISSVNYLNDYCPTPLEENEKERVLIKINDLSENFKVSTEF